MLAVVFDIHLPKSRVLPLHNRVTLMMMGTICLPCVDDCDNYLCTMTLKIVPTITMYIGLSPIHVLLITIYEYHYFTLIVESELVNVDMHA